MPGVAGTIYQEPNNTSLSELCRLRCSLSPEKLSQPKLEPLRPFQAQTVTEPNRDWATQRLVARAIRNAIRANRFARIIRN